jgi:hypothetical protein
MVKRRSQRGPGNITSRCSRDTPSVSGSLMRSRTRAVTASEAASIEHRKKSSGSPRALRGSEHEARNVSSRRREVVRGERVREACVQPNANVQRGVERMQAGPAGAAQHGSSECEYVHERVNMLQALLRPSMRELQKREIASCRRWHPAWDLPIAIAPCIQVVDEGVERRAWRAGAGKTWHDEGTHAEGTI